VSSPTGVGHWPIFCVPCWVECVTRRREQIEKLVEPAVEAMGYELAELEWRLGPGRGLLRLFIDKDDGITLDDCEQVSRQVAAMLDVEDPIPGDYVLEVSSPGLDRKLVKPAHYDRFAGCEVKVKLRRMIDQRRRLRGTLLAREGANVLLRVDGDTVTLPMAEIDVARLVPDPGEQ
jgi:ribosome maturation factor RimP